MKRRNKAVFLDRDGTLVREVDYLVDPGQLKLLRGAPQAIKSLRAAGFKLVVVSNQSAIARGMLSMKGLSRITKTLDKMLASQGAKVDAYYYCPHHPDYGRPCSCRKPGQKLLKQAAKRFKIDFQSSFFVGDTTTDMMTAKRAGLTGLLVRTGYGGKDGWYRVKPRKAFKDLAAAARWIVASRP